MPTKHLVKARPALILPRRRFLISGAALLAAPAIARAGNMTLLGVGKPAATSTGLRTNLSAFWNLDTNSWVDSTGNGSTLSGAGTNAVTIGSGTGPGGNNCAVFDGTNWLTVASNSHLITNNTSFSASMWFNIGSLSNGTNLIGKKGFAFAQDEWSVYDKFTTGNFWTSALWDTGGNSFELVSTGSASATSWVHVVITYNVSNDAFTIYVNGSSAGSMTGPNPVNSTTADFSINRSGTSSSAGSNSFALVGFWQGRVLSSSDVTLLRNGGSGLTYAQMA